MKKVYGDDCLSRSRIYEWFKRFQEGREALEDDERSAKRCCERRQVRTNIGLADTLIPSSFIYFSYMGGNEPCDSPKIIFVNHVYS